MFKKNALVKLDKVETAHRKKFGTPQKNYDQNYESHERTIRLIM